MGPAAAGGIGDLLTSPFGWAWEKVAAGIAGWVLGAVRDVVDAVAATLGRTSGIDLGALWFAGPGSPLAVVREVAVGLAALFILVGLLQGLLRGDAGFMVRQVVLGVPLAALGIAATTWAVAHVLALTDALAASVLASQSGEALHFLSGFGATAAAMTGGFAAVLLGLLSIVGALLLWIELVVRSALLYVLVALTPLAFAATLWPAARGVLRRSIELLVAVVVAKLVIAIALAVGVAALGGAGTAGVAPGLGTLLEGSVVIGLAAFAPFLVLRLVPAVEAAVVAHGISRLPVRGAERAASLTMTGTSVVRLAGSAATPFTLTPNAASAPSTRVRATRVATDVATDISTRTPTDETATPEGRR